MNIPSTLRLCPLPGCAMLCAMLLPGLIHAQTSSIEYRGVIGEDRRIIMNLQKKVERLDDGGQPVTVTRYSGTYSYDSQDTPIRLSGYATRYDDQTNDPFGMIQIEEDVDGTQTGSFSGQITSGGVFTGNWNNAEYTSSYPFILYPADAGGADAALRDVREFSEFWRLFKGLVKKDVKEKIADMSVFPLSGSGYVLGRWDRGLDRKEFLKNYKKVFDDKARGMVEKTGFRDLYPTVVSAGNLWGLPGGTVLYFMVVESGNRGDEGETSIGFGFGKVEGKYKLMVMEIAG